MTKATFIWRVRICLLLLAASLVMLERDRGAAPRHPVVEARQSAVCAAPSRPDGDSATGCRPPVRPADDRPIAVPVVATTAP